MFVNGIIELQRYSKGDIELLEVVSPSFFGCFNSVKAL
jgi:hypothetical protein